MTSGLRDGYCIIQYFEITIFSTTKNSHGFFILTSFPCYDVVVLWLACLDSDSELRDCWETIKFSLILMVKFVFNLDFPTYQFHIFLQYNPPTPQLLNKMKNVQNAQKIFKWIRIIKTNKLDSWNFFYFFPEIFNIRFFYVDSMLRCSVAMWHWFCHSLCYRPDSNFVPSGSCGVLTGWNFWIRY